jgi:hypothetical protein
MTDGTQPTERSSGPLLRSVPRRTDSAAALLAGVAAEYRGIGSAGVGAAEPSFSWRR